MNKIIVAISGVVLLSLAVVLLVSAQGKPEDSNKAQTEMSKDCAKCPEAATCADATTAEETTATKPCCPEGQATETAASATCETKTAEMPGCAATCPMKAAPKTN